MIYHVKMVADGSTRQVEGASLAEVVDQLDAPFRRISISSGLQEIVLLEPLNDLPGTWTKEDLPQSPSGDSVALVRLLVKRGLVAGATGPNRLTVDPGSLLSWAESTVQASFAELLPSPPAEGVPERRVEADGDGQSSDDRQYAARIFAAGAEAAPPTHCSAYHLVQEAFGTILGREDFLARDRPLPVAPGNGLVLRIAADLLASILLRKEGHARLSIERQANWTALALTTFGPDDEEQAPSCLSGTPGSVLRSRELLLQASVLAGLSLRTWDDEGDTVLPWIGNQCLRVQAKRSLDALYGPVLDLRWCPATGGFLAPEQPAQRQTAKAPSVLGRLVTASADWQGRHRFALLAVGIALFAIGMLVPGQHGLPSGIALVWTGMVCCLEPQRREPGIWMLLCLVWVGTLFFSACCLYGTVHDLRCHPDVPGSTLVEEWLMLLIFLAPNLYLWDRTRASLRRDRAIRQAIQPRG